MKFERKSKYVFVILTYLFVLVLQGKAQTNMVFYPMENQINAPTFNPAFFNVAKQIYIGDFSTYRDKCWL